ncbi:hypothetical protein UT300009_30150 [Paraclostridium bifermentans]
MIKIFVNGLEVITLEATMDLRLGRKITFLGTEYAIQQVESTQNEMKVYLVHEKDFKPKHDDRVYYTAPVRPFANALTPNRNPFL